MTYLEIDKALMEITRAKCAECKARLDAIPKEKATERKALQVEYGMYSFCGAAGFLLSYERSKAIQTRERFLSKQIHKYPKLNERYQLINEEEKKCFIAALQAEMFIRDQWFGAQKIELAAAEESGDAKKAFEFKIKVGAVENMFAAWEAWRRENGVYPNMFEEGKV